VCEGRHPDVVPSQWHPVLVSFSFCNIRTSESGQIRNTFDAEAGVWRVMLLGEDMAAGGAFVEYDTEA
jgi:hypothetical protein